MRQLAVVALALVGLAFAQDLKVTSHSAGRNSAVTFVVGEVTAPVAVRDVRVIVTFLSEDGAVLDSDEATALVRTVGPNEVNPFIATTSVDGAARYRWTAQAARADSFHPRLDVQDAALASTVTGPAVSGIVSNPHDQPVRSVKVSASGYQDGEVVAVGFTFTDDVPPGGEAHFTAHLDRHTGEVDSFRVWAEGRY